MNIRHNEKLRDRLAAEYVLGTLKGGARRRFEYWLKNDFMLRQAVAEWQERLSPLSEFAPPVQPPQQVWNRINQRIESQVKKYAPSARLSWWDSINFWRRFGVASSVTAALLVAIMLVQSPQTIESTNDYAAFLNDEKSRTVMVVTTDAGRRKLTVKAINAQNINPDKSLELWALPKEGPPRSLGLVPADGAVTLTMPEDIPAQSLAGLAVSLEPKGGSPNPNAPTGPILLKGEWVKI